MGKGCQDGIGALQGGLGGGSVVVGLYSIRVYANGVSLCMACSIGRQEHDTLGSAANAIVSTVDGGCGARTHMVIGVRREQKARSLG